MPSPKSIDTPRYRVTWVQTIQWEAEVDASSLRSALAQAESGDLFESARQLGASDHGFQAEEVERP
jgi:hypothetical protein